MAMGFGEYDDYNNVFRQLSMQDEMLRQKRSQIAAMGMMGAGLAQAAVSQPTQAPKEPEFNLALLTGDDDEA